MVRKVKYAVYTVQFYFPITGSWIDSETRRKVDIVAALDLYTYHAQDWPQVEHGHTVRIVDTNGKVWFD